MTIPTPQQTFQAIQAWKQQPNRFCLDILGSQLWQRQVEIIEAVQKYPEVDVPSCHGSGKSYTAAHVALHFLFTHPHSIVITTAPTGRQVRKVLWQEIRRAYANSKVPLGGEILQTELKISDKWFCFGFSTDEPTNFSGLHAEHILVIIDEATGVQADIWEGIAGVLSAGDAHLLAIGNPTDEASEFAIRCRRSNGERSIVLPISAYDTPNFTAFGITESDIAGNTWREKITGPLPFPYLISPQFAADVYSRYGPDSAMYQSRVLGCFPQGSADTLIPLSWILSAVERWKERTEQIKQGIEINLGPEPPIWGDDVARFGTDRTVRTKRHGVYVYPQRVTQQENLMQTTGRVVADLREDDKSTAHVDVIGLGAGVVDRGKEVMGGQADRVKGINVAEAAVDEERFANKRAEGYWRLREAFETQQIMIPDDDELIGELMSIKYKVVNSNGKIKIEEKEEAKKRLGKSPDLADSLMLTYIPEAEPASAGFWSLD